MFAVSVLGLVALPYHGGMPGPSALPAFEHRFIEAAGVRLHLVELPGTGPPCLLIHGIGMDWRVWQAVARRLHPYFQLYFVDLRGHGSSDKPASGYSVADYAADIEDVLESLELQSVILIGSSLGGMVAAAVEAPRDLVSSRVLVDPPLTGGPVRDAAMFEHILTLKHAPVPELAAYLGKQNPGAGQFLLRSMSEMWHEAADGVITEMLRDVGTYNDLDSTLAAIESPVLILRADPARGGVLSARDAERALRLLPHGRVTYLPGAGHAIHATHPVEFTHLVVDFATET